MKNLTNLKNKEIKIQAMSNIYGCGQWVATNPPDTKDANGCTVHTTDSWYDANGNGKRGLDESMTICVSVDCGNNG
jgi:hypothetical protein